MNAVWAFGSRRINELEIAGRKCRLDLMDSKICTIKCLGRGKLRMLRWCCGFWYSRRLSTGCLRQVDLIAGADSAVNTESLTRRDCQANAFVEVSLSISLLGFEVVIDCLKVQTRGIDSSQSFSHRMSVTGKTLESLTVTMMTSSLQLWQNETGDCTRRPGHGEYFRPYSPMPSC